MYYVCVTKCHQNKYIYMLTNLPVLEEDTWLPLVHTSLFESMKRI